MQFTLKKLLLTFSTICVLTIGIGYYLNHPGRHLELAGSVYAPNTKSRDWVRANPGHNFTDQQLRQIVAVVPRMGESQYVTLSGANLTDDGMMSLKKAKNIISLELFEMNVSDKILEYVATMPDLKYLKIHSCPNITMISIDTFRGSNRGIQVETSANK